MASTKGKKNSPRKEVILEKAAHLFRKNGFNATSMRDLAENVGVEAASLIQSYQFKGRAAAGDMFQNCQQVYRAYG